MGASCAVLSEEERPSLMALASVHVSPHLQVRQALEVCKEKPVRLGGNASAQGLSSSFALCAEGNSTRLRFLTFSESSPYSSTSCYLRDSALSY